MDTEETKQIGDLQLTRLEVSEAVGHYVDTLGAHWLAMQSDDVKAKLIAAYWYKIKTGARMAKSPASTEADAVNEWYVGLSLDEAEDLAAKYGIGRVGGAPWQMAHYEDRLRAYLGEKDSTIKKQ